jgi:hypothetical protein
MLQLNPCLIFEVNLLFELDMIIFFNLLVFINNRNVSLYRRIILVFFIILGGML